MITITLQMPVIHGSSPRDRAVQALETLKEAIETASPDELVLEDLVRDSHGRRLGSYRITLE